MEAHGEHRLRSVGTARNNKTDVFDTYLTPMVLNMIRWFTIMSSACGQEATRSILHFSNPDVSYDNGNRSMPTGSSSKNNAQIIRDNMVRALQYVTPWCHRSLRCIPTMQQAPVRNELLPKIHAILSRRWLLVGAHLRRYDIKKYSNAEPQPRQRLRHAPNAHHVEIHLTQLRNRDR